MFRSSSSLSYPVRHVQTLFDVCSDLFDMDRSGSISLHEFAGLFNYINEWKRMFEGVDTDRSGFIEAHEFAQGTAAVYRFILHSLSVCFADMFDANGSGTIDVGEFSQLFNYINQWKGRMLSHTHDYKKQKNCF